MVISETEIEVRYAETDQMGVVYHANYLIWFEVARTHFLERLGFPYKDYEERGLISPVTHAELDYIRPLKYGDVVTVFTRVENVSPVRCEYVYEIYSQDQTRGEDNPSCVGRTQHCFVGKNDFKPLSMKKIDPALYDAYISACEGSK